MSDLLRQPLLYSEQDVKRSFEIVAAASEVLGRQSTKIAVNNHSDLLVVLDHLTQNHVRPGHLYEILTEMRKPDSKGRKRAIVQTKSKVGQVLKALTEAQGGNLRRGISRKKVAKILGVKLSDNSVQSTIKAISRIFREAFGVNVKSYKGHIKVLTVDEIELDQVRLQAQFIGMYNHISEQQDYLRAHSVTQKQLQTFQVAILELEDETTYANHN